MMMLIETIYHPDGKTTITEKGFSSKNEIIKVIKAQAPIEGKVIYELSKYNVAHFNFLGSKRKWQIVNEVTRDRE